MSRHNRRQDAERCDLLERAEDAERELGELREAVQWFLDEYDSIDVDGVTLAIADLRRLLSPDTPTR